MHAFCPPPKQECVVTGASSFCFALLCSPLSYALSLIYRFTEGSYSSQSSGRELQRVRQPFLERRVLSKWDSFTIWGCGRDGRRFFNALDPLLAQRVVAFCDIDPIKIARGYHDRKSRRHIPVIRFSDAVPPFIICVSPKLCGRALEENINSLGLTEGRDYVRFC